MTNAIAASTALTTYKFSHGMELRTVTKDGEPWFIAADACRALDIINTAQALANVDASDKDMVNIGLRGRSPWFINESGLYDLILQSRKPDAKAFRKWVTSVVLPAIRKDGMYVAGEEKVSTGEMSLEEMTLKVMAGLQDKLARLTQENLEMAPKALVYDAVVVSKQLTLKPLLNS